MSPNCSKRRTQLLHYDWQWQVGTAGAVTDIEDSDDTFVIIDIGELTEREFQVRARATNSVDNGAWSEWQSVTLPDIPTAPTSAPPTSAPAPVAPATSPANPRMVNKLFASLGQRAEVRRWDEETQAGVGYTVNSLSLIYRSDLIEAEITSWADLLRDDVAGFVSIPEMSTTFGPAALIMIDRALAMQELDESEELEEINYDADLAWEALPQLADNLVTTYIRSSELTTLVQEEEVWVAPYASFAIGNLVNTGHDLTTVAPEEGLVGQTNMISITAATDQVELAHAYIDWFISHDVQQAEALDLIDSPTNATVELPEDICALLTCGEMLDTMIVLDQAEVSDRLEDWLERWNEVMVR